MQPALGLTAIVLPGYRAIARTLLASQFEEAEFVYISPVQSNGEESSCLGEVWFGPQVILDCSATHQIRKFLIVVTL